MTVIEINHELSLLPYYANEAEALVWYQDKETCKMVDNIDQVYDIDRLKAMYHYLDQHGDCFYVKYRGKLVGDCSLQDSGELAIVICKEFQGRGIGSRCIQAMVQRAQDKNMAKVFARIYSFNERSRQMFMKQDFQQVEEELFELVISNKLCKH